MLILFVYTNKYISNKKTKMNFSKQIVVLFFLIIFWFQQTYAYLSFEELERDIFAYENEILFQDENISTEEEILKDIANNTANLMDNFPFDIHFQNPSYILNKEINWKTLLCDESYDECKLNLKITEQWKETISSKFICQLSFSWATVSEDENCNPNTYIIDSGFSELNIKIFEKDMPELYYKQTLRINKQNHHQEDSFKIILQNPSYVSKKGEDEIDYFCDTDKKECKVNFLLAHTNQKPFSSSVSCEITFSDHNIDNIKSCNPRSLVFNQDITEVQFQVQFQNNTLNKKIFIHNNQGIEDKIPLDSRNGNKWHENQLDIEKNKLLEQGIILDIQSGLEQASDTDYVCKDKKCKVNFDISHTFTWGVSEKNYFCRWDFWTGSIYKEGTETKCNPWYVEFWNMLDRKISASIFQKTTENEILKTYYNIQPFVAKKPNSIVSSPWNSAWSDYKIYASEIEIQSWLNERGECIKNNCKINLEYKDTSYETCRWDFAELHNTYEKFTNNCNPGYMDIPVWNFVFHLQVSNSRSGNVEIKKLYIKNYSNQENSTLDKIPTLVLQGKKLDYRSLSGNKVSCNGVKKCSINLTLENVARNADVYWDFWNGEHYTGINPPSLWFPIWIYHWSIYIQDKNNENYQINFELDISEWKSTNIENKYKSIDYFKNIQFYYVVPNPKGSDDFEYIVIQNIWENEVNLSWLNMDDKLESWSKPYVFSNKIIEAKSLLLIPKSESGLSLHNSDEKLYLIYNGEIIDSVWWNTSIWEGDKVFQWKILKSSEENKEDLIWWNKNHIYWFTKKFEVYKNKNLHEYLKKPLITFPETDWWEKEQIMNKPRLTKTVHKQKKSIKISWKTEPWAIVYIEAQWKIYEFQADSFWKYQMKLYDFPVGEYELKYNVLLDSGELFVDTWVKDISISQNYLASIASVPVRTELKKKKKEKKSTMKEKNLLQVVPEVVAHSLPAKERYDPKKELVPNYLYCLYFIFACIGLYFVWRKNSFWKKNNLDF